ncbi:MAG TPA: ferritin-like domain-containing protein, partial [Rhodothermales bacterium]|nr:ferritin-like domain-containing protein [Rhodothermales bacterium]
ASNGIRRGQFGDTDIAILNYALTLEYLERAFYNRGVDSGIIAAADLPLFTLIRNDERAHVDLLAGAITTAGGTPVVYDDNDFTFVVNGTDALTDYTLFKVVAQAFEDTGVRAYKGKAADITNPAYLTVALQIHSVEARHAAAVRKLNGNTAWIPLNQPNAQGTPIAAVYNEGNPEAMFPGEENLSQGTLDLRTALSGYTDQEISEAFDEPLDEGTVNAIAGPFITPA